MSHGMTAAVRACAGHLRDVLPTVERHRPSVAAAVLVARELADRFRDDRGCVNESVGQICDATGLSDGQVRDALGALELLGVWVADGKGNQHRPTVRRPGPVLLHAIEHGGPPRVARDTATRDYPRSTPVSNAGLPAEHTSEQRGTTRGAGDLPTAEHRGKTTGASRAGDPSIAGQPATPPTQTPIHVTSPTTDSHAWADPPVTDEPTPPDDRGSLIWAQRLADTVGAHSRLTETQIRAELLTAHHTDPTRPDADLIADLEARSPT